MTTTFDSLAENYDAGRIGYANEVYNHLVDFGLNLKHRIVDIGCGTGLASGPLIDNNFTVAGVDPSEPMLAYAKRRYPNAEWVVGTAEKLPFGDASFDAAISAQTIHRVDRAAAIAEIRRVLKPNGVVAIWWKNLMGDDAVKTIRDASAQEVGIQIPPSGLNGGFKEFYAAAWRDQTLRIIPWRASMPLSQVVEMERSRADVRDRAGNRSDMYFAAFERRLNERFGQGNPHVPVAYMHYLYLAKN